MIWIGVVLGFVLGYVTCLAVDNMILCRRIQRDMEQLRADLEKVGTNDAQVRADLDAIRNSVQTISMTWPPTSEDTTLKAPRRCSGP